MTAEKLLAEFGTLAETPSGTGRLRELVIQLAVRGQLGTHDSADPDASPLANELKATRLALSRAGKLKAANELPPVSEDETPFQVPPNWAWTRIGSAMNLVNGRAFKPSDWSTSGLPIIRIQNLNNPSAPFNRCAFEVESKFHVKPGDFLISWSGTPGTSFGAFIWNGPAGILNQHIFRAELLGRVYVPAFLRIAINSRLDEMIAQAHGGVGLQHITKGKLENLSIPLPPRAEQKRIVAKVAHLMALCDELEHKQTQKHEVGALLTRAALDALTSAEGPEEFAAAWRRVADNFDVLSERSERVGEFRKAILGLALHGRLEEQAPADEDVDTLLARISRDRTGSKVRGGRSTDESPQEEAERHTLPESWRWVTVGEVADCVLGKMLDKAKHKTGVLRPYLRNINVRWGAFDLTDLLSMYFEDDELERYGVRDGDVLICEGGEPGRSAVWRDNSKTMLIQKAIHRVRLFGGISPEWLVMNLRYDSWTGRLAQYFTGATIKHFTGQALTRYSIRLPPIAEQKRIIAKVDQLMALCDELETKLRDAEKGTEHLAEAMTAAMVV
jgi:type I restriction enzyme S subunit